MSSHYFIKLLLFFTAVQNKYGTQIKVHLKSILNGFCAYFSILLINPLGLDILSVFVVQNKSNTIRR